MGTGRPNLPSPVSCIPCPRAFFLGFFPYRLQDFKYCHVTCLYLFRFPLFWIRTAISRPSPLPLDLNPSHPLSFPTVSPVIFLMWVACELFNEIFALRGYNRRQNELRHFAQNWFFFYVLLTSKGGNMAFLHHPLCAMLCPCSSYL